MVLVYPHDSHSEGIEICSRYFFDKEAEKIRPQLIDDLEEKGTYTGFIGFASMYNITKSEYKKNIQKPRGLYRSWRGTNQLRDKLGLISPAKAEFTGHYDKNKGVWMRFPVDFKISKGKSRLLEEEIDIYELYDTEMKLESSSFQLFSREYWDQEGELVYCFFMDGCYVVDYLEKPDEVYALLIDAHQRFENKLSSVLSKTSTKEKQIQRQHISDEEQIFVWNRDRGRCVKCDSNENLEFDHIIPLSKGGSNTARNIQLLCQTCNRAKGDKIGG